MDLRTKNATMGTPKKDPLASNASENSNPNVAKGLSPNPKLTPRKSPVLKVRSPRDKIKERKFVVAKKKNKVGNSKANSNCKCKDKSNAKCLCVAYESLRASQEEFFKHQDTETVVANIDYDEGKNEGAFLTKVLPKQNENRRGSDVRSSLESNENGGNHEPEETESPKGILGSASIKRRRDMLMEEARVSIPEPGSGRVMHLVSAFERLLSIPKRPEVEDEKTLERDAKHGMKWALPGLQRPEAPETEDTQTAFCPGNLFFTAESLGLGSSVSSSADSSHGSGSRRSSTESWRSRRSGSISSNPVGGRKGKKKQPKVTSLKPFKLRTEQRGKEKEEEFCKKLQEMMIEEEKLRIPIAQGLPWTTDEPECLVRPPVKDSTKPVDLKLHTDERAVKRSEFDNQMTEKLMQMEQYRLEKERQLKLAEEEEIRKMRKELVPIAQPMPYFDRPFIPKRSEKQPTVPKEPKFLLQQHKKMKSCLSWNEFDQFRSQCLRDC